MGCTTVTSDFWENLLLLRLGTWDKTKVRRTGLSSHTEQRLRVACSLLAILLETTSSVVVLILTWRILRASDPLDKVVNAAAFGLILEADNAAVVLVTRLIDLRMKRRYRHVLERCPAGVELEEFLGYLSYQRRFFEIYFCVTPLLAAYLGFFLFYMYGPY